MLSFLVWPIVITLSGFYCNTYIIDWPVGLKMLCVKSVKMFKCGNLLQIDFRTLKTKSDFRKV